MDVQALALLRAPLALPPTPRRDYSPTERKIPKLSSIDCPSKSRDDVSHFVVALSMIMTSYYHDRLRRQRTFYFTVTHISTVGVRVHVRVYVRTIVFSV